MKERGGNPFKKAREFVRSLLVHDATPSTLDYTRRELLEQWNFVQDYIGQGVISGERLEEIRKDDKLQSHYRQLLDGSSPFNKNPIDLEYELRHLSIHEYAGFLIHKIEYFEKRFNVKFVSREED